MLRVGSTVNLENANIDNNKLIYGELKHDMHIDEGMVAIYGIIYNIVMESTNITISNQNIGSMTYHYNGYIFNISNGLVRFRGECIDISQFVLTVPNGRIRLDGSYYSFTIANNILTIGAVTNYRTFDLQNVPNRDYTPMPAYAPLPIYNRDALRNYRYGDYPMHYNEDINLRPHKTLKAMANDSQNVHDSYILNHLQKIIAKIQAKTKITKSIDKVLEEMAEYVLERDGIVMTKYCLSRFFKKNILDSYVTNQAIRTIKYIRDSNGYIGTFRMTEVQVLQLIWNAIYDNEDLKNILYLNILDMSMLGGTSYVCLTGRVTRMIDIFTGIIDEFTFKDDKNLREEMLNKCAQIRNELEAADIQDINDKYKTTMKEKLMNEYVEGGILSLDDFNKEVGEWIDHI